MKFLAFIQAIDDQKPKVENPQLEPRRVRRQKARDAAKSPKLANPPAAKKAC